MNRQRFFIILLLIFIFSVINYPVEGQKNKQDSLKELLSDYHKTDTFQVNRLIELAILTQKVDVDEFYTYVVSIDSLSEVIAYDYGKATGQKLLGEYYRKKYLLKESNEAFLQAIKGYDEALHKKEIAHCRLMMGRNHYSMGHFTEALDFFEQSRVLFAEIDNVKELGNSTYLIGVSYSRLGDYSNAMEFTQKALEYFELDANKNGMAGANHLLGIICNYQGNYPKTIEYYDKALKIRNELNNKEGVSALYMSIGIIYYYQKDYPTSLDYLHKSLEIALGIDEKILVSQCYNNIAEVYTDQRLFDKAMKYNQKSMEIKKELGDISGMASCYINFGNVFTETNELQKATVNYEEALSLGSEIEEKKLQAEAYVGLANVYLKRKQYKKSYGTSKKANSLALEVDNVNVIKSSAEILALSSEAMQLYKEAYKAHVLFKNYSDSINNENSINEIARLKYKLQYEEELQAKAVEQERKDAIEKAKARRQKMILFGFMSGFVLALILMLLFRVRLSKAYKDLKSNNVILNKAKEKAEESDRLKSAFLNNLSHEIRTPMNSIFGFSNLFISPDLSDDERKEYGEIISKGCDQLLLIIDDIVDMAALQSGQYSVSNSPIDLKTICEKTISAFKDQAQFKGIHLEGCKKNGVLGQVMGDEEKILKVLHHLIDNAIKFTPEGTIKIGAQIREDWIEFFVADSGIGIDPELHQKIFESFYQAEYNSTRFYGGNGLGLTICKVMVELMKGKIWVDSIPGEGAIFHFTIPNIPVVLNKN